MKTYRNDSIMRTVQHNGEFTARLLQYQDIQNGALALAMRENELRIAGIRAKKPPFIFRFGNAAGAVLVRLGTRLQHPDRTRVASPAL